MAHIHPSAVIHPGAELSEDVTVGPFCYVGDKVKLGAGCVLKSHVVIEGPSTFGERNIFYPFANIGLQSQDLKYQGEPTFLEVGHDNVFRESANVNRGTFSTGKTRIGNHNHFLVASHLGHDCTVGNHVILSGYAAVAGHCQIDDYAIVSGASAVHQFVRIGEHSLVGGVARIDKDVPPFMIVEGHPGRTRALNAIGIQRRGFSPEDISALKFAYKKLFLNIHHLSQAEACALIASDPVHGKNPHVERLLTFVQSSERGIS